MDPFYRVDGSTVKYVLVIIPTFTFLISLFDLYCWLVHYDQDMSISGEKSYRVCTLGQQRMYDNIIFIGGGVTTRLLDYLTLPDKELVGALTMVMLIAEYVLPCVCLLYTSPSPRD